MTQQSSDPPKPSPFSASTLDPDYASSRSLPRRRGRGHDTYRPDSAIDRGRGQSDTRNAPVNSATHREQYLHQVQTPGSMGTSAPSDIGDNIVVEQRRSLKRPFAASATSTPVKVPRTTAKTVPGSAPMKGTVRSMDSVELVSPSRTETTTSTRAENAAAGTSDSAKLLLTMACYLAKDKKKAMAQAKLKEIKSDVFADLQTDPAYAAREKRCRQDVEKFRQEADNSSRDFGRLLERLIDARVERRLQQSDTSITVPPGMSAQQYDELRAASTSTSLQVTAPQAELAVVRKDLTEGLTETRSVTERLSTELKQMMHELQTIKAAIARSEGRLAAQEGLAVELRQSTRGLEAVKTSLRPIEGRISALEESESVLKAAVRAGQDEHYRRSNEEHEERMSKIKHVNDLIQEMTERSDHRERSLQNDIVDLNARFEALEANSEDAVKTTDPRWNSLQDSAKIIEQDTATESRLSSLEDVISKLDPLSAEVETGKQILKDTQERLQLVEEAVEKLPSVSSNHAGCARQSHLVDPQEGLKDVHARLNTINNNLTSNTDTLQQLVLPNLAGIAAGLQRVDQAVASHDTILIRIRSAFQLPFVPSTPSHSTPPRRPPNSGTAEHVHSRPGARSVRADGAVQGPDARWLVPQAPQPDVRPTDVPPDGRVQNHLQREPTQEL